MIITVFSTIAQIIMLPFVFLVNATLGAFQALPVASDTAIHYIFENMGVFNSILPVTELMLFAGLAISFKLAFFTFKIIMIVFSLMKYVFKSVVNIWL